MIITGYSIKHAIQRYVTSYELMLSRGAVHDAYHAKRVVLSLRAIRDDHRRICKVTVRESDGTAQLTLEDALRHRKELKQILRTTLTLQAAVGDPVATESLMDDYCSASRRLAAFETAIAEGMSNKFDTDLYEIHINESWF